MPPTQHLGMQAPQEEPESVSHGIVVVESASRPVLLLLPWHLCQVVEGRDIAQEAVLNKKAWSSSRSVEGS